MQEGSAATSDSDLELLRSGIRLMALRAHVDPNAADEVAQQSTSDSVKQKAPATETLRGLSFT